ncbi:hypothetical protein BF28_5861 (plasmid) [Bacillus cereus E33L]|uniref:Uncharacterized protein n=1 Tax=Bacillus cereus (strain ZK / E33L) TaxID=288681 RepID=Q4V156_BACCZ|nr:hypothetical protein pE33L466_0411 [Bacillus cereus E33L]AJI26000.1 hypothetical protein BF28_5861 [Bacillus cereus E33L]
MNVFVTNLIVKVNPSVGLRPLAIIINNVDLPARIVPDGATPITITLSLNAITLVLGHVKLHILFSLFFGVSF